MRLGLILLSVPSEHGLRPVAPDREEPVENGPREEKAEPVLKPSEVLKPKSLEIASPVSDRFYVRLTAYSAGVETSMRLDPTLPAIIIIPPPPLPPPVFPEGTELRPRKTWASTTRSNRRAWSSTSAWASATIVRIDYFKLNRFGEVGGHGAITFGDVDFEAGDRIRTKLDWRVLSLTYTYSLFKAERFEAGAGIGVHVIEAHAELGEPGTLNRENFSEVAPFATVAATAAYRISKRWAITMRGQTFEYSRDDLTGRLSDFHADIQYRWRKNMAVGIGYTSLRYELEHETDAPPEAGDQPAFFDMNLEGPELFFRASF